MRSVPVLQERSVGLSSVPDHELRSAHVSHATPSGFVVDDDISVRESLELLVCNAGWH
jgi:hypothetical protein